MGNRLLSLVFCFSLLVCGLAFGFMQPPNAMAEIHAASLSDYTVYCTADGKMHKNSEDGEMIANVPGVSWSSADGGKLVLNNCSFTTSATPAVSLPAGASVELSGDNAIGTWGGVTALLGRGNLTVNGPGKLSLSVSALNDAVSDAYALKCDGELTVTNATIDTALTIDDHEQNTYGIMAEAKCTFNNAKIDSSYFSGGGKTQSFAIGVRSGTFTSNDSTVVAQSGDVTDNGSSSVALYAQSKITIKGGRLTAQGGGVSVKANGAVSGSSDAVYSASGLIDITDNASVSVVSGAVNVESSNSKAASALSRGIYIGSTSKDSKCYFTGANTVINVVAGNALGRGGSGSSSTSIGICAPSSVAAHLMVTNARLIIKSGDVGASNVPSTDCCSYGFLGTGTTLNGGYLKSEAGAVQTSATSTVDKQYIASYGYMGSVYLKGSYSFSSRGGAVSAGVVLERYNGSFGWGVPPGMGLNTSSYHLKGDDNTSNPNTLLLSGYSAASNYKYNVHLSSTAFSSHTFLVGDMADGSDRAPWTEASLEDAFAKKYVLAGVAKTIAVPSITTSFVYNGSQRTAISTGSGYTLTGTASATDVGDYQVTATLNDELATWSDGSAAAKVIDWSITKRDSSVALPDRTVAYSGNPVADSGAQVTGTEGAVSYKYYNDAQGQTEISAPVNAGTYYFKAFAAEDANNTAAESRIAKLTIQPKSVTVSVNSGLVYNGNPQTGVAEGEGYELSGTTSATDPGTYTARAGLVSANYAWSDGTTSEKTISWSIYRYATTIKLSDKVFDYDGKTHDIGAAVIKGSTGPITYRYYDDKSLKIERSGYPKDSGVYYVRAEVEASGEYAGALSNVATLTINRIDANISGATKFVVTGKVGRTVSIDLSQRASYGSLVYTSSDPTFVTVNAAGKATVLKNHTGKVIISVKAVGDKNHKTKSREVGIFVKPGKMSVAKAKNAKKRSAKISWSKMAGADKYQLQLALNKSFKKGKKTYSVNGSLSSKTVTKLKKGKAYYARIRAYDKQTNSWGAWSAAKKVKVRK